MSAISVIIPTWNRADTIEKAVRSALSQTLPPSEVLVCDDGSTDNTRELVHAINDARVRWLQGPRGGRPAIPRNRGIKESRGEWLAFLDSDDEWLPEKLEKQLCLAKNLNCKAISSNAHRFVPGKGIEGDLLSRTNEQITFDDLLYVNQIICSSILVHRSLFAIVDGFPEDPQLKALEDYALWLRIATQTDFAFVTEPLLIYRDDPLNSLRNKGTDIWTQRKAVLTDFKSWGQQKISDAYLRKAGKQYMIALLKGKQTMFFDFIMRLKRASFK